jgi:N-acetylglucosamine-6-phosphate deacetylase
MSDVRFKDGVRNVGLREYALIEPRLTAELIADNKHIMRELGLMIYNAKGSEKLCVVSDSLSAAGMENDGRTYKIGAGENAQRIVAADGVARTEAGIFAGSITPIVGMVKNLVEWGIPLVEAVKMGSLIPARVIHEDHRIGSIEIGKLADVCIIDGDFNVKNVIIGGKTVK